MLKAQDRVRLWNSFFYLAWQSAKRLFEISRGCETSAVFTPKGGMLEDEQRASLAAVIFCTLAIEARANHVIQKLLEDGRITDRESEAAQRLPPEAKWFLLPKLAGRRRALRSDAGPHQVVSQICALRNDLVHVRFHKLVERLPQSGTMLSYFGRLVEAFEDMNILLRDARRPRGRVLRMGRFKCD